MFNEKQRKFIQSLGLKLDFNHLTDDDLVNIEDAVAELSFAPLQHFSPLQLSFYT